MARFLRPLAFAGFAFSMIAAAWSPPAFADGSPVVSLAPTLLGRTGITAYSTVASPITIARVVGYGSGPDFTPIYDTTVLSSVTSRPVSNVLVNGENVDIEYDDEAAARLPHTLPEIVGVGPSWQSSLDLMAGSGS
ncbi:hypothetical protein GXW74_22305 [Roseomonas eburnea]|uniref:Uncharacterized protein n=1 Tax=Neoroseomonas eburnea TaxID=1346889 RepID=A0A9X9XHP9_9PROT|nr:hypothetical protein [Neoroseomonas eburnea]MBR0683235.1 hypothetical protein [Neoroseomonas eburnea]